MFVRDQASGTNILVSADTNGLGGADGWSFDPSISGDGRYVVFTSGADNLVAGDTNGSPDVFLRDTQTGMTTLVSVNAAGTGPGSYASFSPTISTDGRYVVFHSLAGNLLNGMTAKAENLFLRDLQLATNYAITTYRANNSGLSLVATTPDNRFVAYALPSFTGFMLWDRQAMANVYTNSQEVSSLAISPDGNRIVFAASQTGGFYGVDRAAHSNWLIAASVLANYAGRQFNADSRFMVYSTAAAQVADDTNGVADVYLYDLQTRGNQLISQSCLRAGAANAASDSPTISPDGRFVAYRSTATDLVVGATNGLPQVYVFDRQTITTTLISLSAFGAFAANSRSRSPAFSGDSQTLVFPSWASDLTAGNFNESEDLFALTLYGSIVPVPFVGQIIFAPGSGLTPLLTWPASVGTNFLVQFKNDLADPAWQNLNVEITVAGNHAYATDLVPGSGRRFYRIVSQ